MNGLVKQVTRTILTVPKYSYTPPPRHSETHHYVTFQSFSPDSPQSVSLIASTKD